MHVLVTGRSTILAAFLAFGMAGSAVAQIQAGDRRMNDPHRSLKEPHFGGSSNIKVLSHIPLGPWSHVMDMEIEQELSRPYAYVARSDWNNDPAFPDGRPRPRQTGGPVQYMPHTSKGVDIIDLKDPSKAKVIYSWRIPQGELHTGTGGMDNKYFKLKGRYYDIQSLQFGQSGPDADVGAVVLDVTGLPDTSRVRQVGFIKTPAWQNLPAITGGFHNFFMYKHSDGRALLFTSTKRVYDMEKMVAGAPDYGMIGEVPVPENPNSTRGGGGYHDVYVGYDPVRKRDVFYGAGSGGYHLYDVSKPEAPVLLGSVTGVSGVGGGHTFTPDPTGRYAVTETEYQFSPLRLFDLKPLQDGESKVVSRPIGAWLGTYDGNSHNHEVRWPYVFVAGYMDGMQVFNMMDPTNPYTVGYYYTCDCLLPGGAQGAGQNGGMDGSFGVDVRNADGLIVTSDRRSGFWAMKMEGFDGWNGHQWGMPNVSSVQDWDNGPDGAPRPTRVSTR